MIRFSIDGSTGEVMVGQIATKTPKLSGDFATVMNWADKHRKLKVRTNADTPADAKRARDFGAQGIGLCRTEHMFFEGERITAMREMILADEVKARKAALKKLLPFQRKDFVGHLHGYEGAARHRAAARSAVARIPAPRRAKAQKEIAKHLGVSVGENPGPRGSMLHEANPMLGHRGCRL